MNFASIIADTPTWAIVLAVVVVVAALCRFRVAASFAMAGFAAFGLWRTDQDIWIAVPFGLVVLAGLTVITNLFTGADDFGGDGGKGYDHSTEQQRLANEYHRRQREGRF